ncbi:MAG TPA: nitroreductase [Clostridiales bacterium]|jgi:nitroreductase|nr:nitroreductase [Clostridiales bacterium]
MKSDFIELSSSRFSVRRFSDKKVEQEKIDIILRAGQVAPTACNNQPQKIYVLQSAEALKTLQRCKYSNFGETLAFLICYDSSLCWIREFDGKPSGEIDAAIVATHMMLEAWELGIGSTWIMHFIPDAVKIEFNLSENIIPVCILVMGYPAQEAAPSVLHSRKKDLKDIVTIL